MCVNGGNDKETVKMDNTKVPRIKKFKHLGSTVQESGSCERERKSKQESAGRMKRMEQSIGNNL